MKRAALALLVACGGGSDPQTPDASNPMDGGPDEATRVEVTVEALSFGTLDPTIVVFYDDTGAVVSHGEVDADGHAHGYLPHGGSVTALRSALDGHRTISLVTVHHIEPGDQLTFDSRPLDPVENGPEDVMTATYTQPTAGDFEIDRACGLTGQVNPQPGAALLLHFFESCTTPTFDMLLRTTGTPHQFLWLPDIPYSGGGNIAVPNSWQATGSLAATFTNLTATPVDANVFVSLLVGPKRVEINHQGVQLSSASPTLTQDWPTGAGRGTVVLAFLAPPLHADVRMVVGSPSASTITVDTTALPLPTFPDDQLPTQSVAGATWAESGTPAGDLRQVTWAARSQPTGQAANDFFVNVFDDPTTPATMTLLPLPDDYADRDPTKVLPVALELVGSVVNYIDYDTMTFADARLHAQRYSTIAPGDGPVVVHTTSSRSFFRP